MLIGIDISKQIFDCYWEESEQAITRQYENSVEGITQFIKDIPDNSHCVMEATGVYHSRVALQLYEAGYDVSVLNPIVIKRFAQMQLSRVKTDQVDAKRIRDYAISHPPSLWSVSVESIQSLKQAHSWLDDLIVERTRAQNRQESINHQVDTDGFVARELKTHLKNLNQQIQACERHLEMKVKKYFPDLYDRLTSIPSIGARTALELIIITEGFERFETDKQLSAYVGVSPTTYKSGTSVKGRGRISHMGKPRLRQLLYLCSWTARRCNPSCSRLYDRMQASGKPGKVINIAIAHKLLRQAFAVAKSGEFYTDYA